MSRKQNFLDKIHQFCSIEFEESKVSYRYLIPLLKAMSDIGKTESRTLLANILDYENKIDKSCIIALYEKSVIEGDPCAMYNLYLIYTENNDEMNAFKYFNMARDKNFPYALEEDFHAEFQRHRGVRN